MIQETWKDISGYDGLYQVSDLGRVRSFWHKKTIIMRQRFFGGRNKCYLSLSLKNKEGKTKIHTVHKLVADTFLGKSHGMVTDHINNIKTDNRLSNIRRITNRLNSSKDKKNKTCPYTGVVLYPWGTYKAQIRIRGKKRHIGCYKNGEDAAKAYQQVVDWLQPGASEEEIIEYIDKFKSL